MVRGVAGPCSVAEGGIHGSRVLFTLWPLPLGRDAGDKHTHTHTYTHTHGKKVWSTQKCGSFHIADDRTLGLGLRDPLRIVYCQIRVAGTFPTPSQQTMQVKISRYAAKGKERGQGGRTAKRLARRTWMLSRGQRYVGTGMEKEGGERTEKEKWFNYAGW
jgi:hypothetical protein